jgi:hypothetical protein
MAFVADLRTQWPRFLLAAGVIVAAVGVCLAWHQVILWSALFVAVGAVVQRSVKRGLDASLLAGVALLYVLFLGLRAVPGQLHRLNETYRSDSRFSSFQQSERAVQQYWGVDSAFVGYVSRHLPRGDPFFVSASTELTDDAPQRWLQFELLPSIEEYGSPCSAKWILFYGTTVVPDGVELGKVLVFKPGYGLARVESPCTS